jgi:hypothetical protein
MMLFHYTCREHLERIAFEGMITTTETNVGAPMLGEFVGAPRGPHFAKDGVWLTTSRSLESADSMGLAGSRYDKTRVQITVDVPDREAKHWLTWAKKKRIHPKWLEAMTSGRDAKSWYVVLRPIPRSEWLLVEDRRSGVLWAAE